jgi:hypothetical protein
MKKSPIMPEVAVVGVVLLIGLLFADYTQHAWEDYWITFRTSRNLATGHGLVYTPGERLHTFTSPLGVLLPAACSWVTGNRSEDLALWMFRVLSAGALAAGVGLLFRAMQTLQLRRVSCWLTAGLIGLDAKTVDFSINGMETGLLVFFLALAIHGLVVSGPRQMIRIAVGWAGLMWTRPDSCVYITILGAGTLLFLSGKTAGKSRIEWGKRLFAAGLVCAVMYLPWFLWAWSYYGSPVPHTIIAKSANRLPISPINLMADLLMFPLRLLVPLDSSMQFAFLPAYAGYGGWQRSLVAVNYVLGLPAVLAWLIPVLRPQARFFSWAYFLGNYFLTDVVRSYYPWYLPTVAVFGYLTIGLIFDQVLGWSRGLPERGWARAWICHVPKVLRVSAVGLVAGQAAMTICVARQMEVQQRLIENGMRREIGFWLRDHARTPQDTVMLEPLGYIGYFSGLKMLDWPGLASKEMVAARKRLGPDQEDQACFLLKPDWMVWRPIEAAPMGERSNQVYQLVQVFDVTDKISATRWLPGRGYLQIDRTFLVFHRKPDPSHKPGG